MSKIVEIHIAELFAGDDNYIITTNGVGSCVVIVLYDKLARIGGMAHAILPHKRVEEEVVQFEQDRVEKTFVKYADEAVDTLIAKMKILGGSEEHMVAKLVGGAHMFVLLEGENHGIGFENTESAREQLRHYGIAIETEVVGGTVGRNIRFDCSTGIVEITTKV
jgi:chemotaxis protein CheD